MDNGTQQALLEALPLLAQMTNGYGMLLDDEGTVLRLVHHSGKLLPKYSGMKIPEAREAVQRHMAVEFQCPADKRRSMWAVPVGGNMLCGTCGSDAMELYKRIRHTFEEALPRIAGVAGGEAVIFDRDGVRTFSVDSRGRITKDYIGKKSVPAQRAMQLQKTTVGESSYIVGAKAVRIPVCSYFGVGFNNNDTVMQRQRLLDEICKTERAQVSFQDIIGDSAQIQGLLREAQAVAALDCNVFLCGEPGTGKELLAQAIHNASGRGGKFVSVNCNTLEQDLMEGVLFGYVDAAYKGVRHGNHDGALRQAQEGTLFLKDVDKLTPAIQRMLYRALSQGDFTPVGGTKKISIDVRVITSACADLAERVEDGQFLRRLYALLSGRALHTHALREHPGDIPKLANAFIMKLNASYGKFVERLESNTADILMHYAWPYNADELWNCLETIYHHIGYETSIKRAHLPERLTSGEGPRDMPKETSYERLMREYEAQVIRSALLQNGNSRRRTAEYLGISTTSLWRKMKTLHIQDDQGK